MFDTTRRKFLVGGLAGLFAAPMIVRASALMPVRAWDIDSAVVHDLSDTLAYEYWAVGPMGLAKYSAKQILDAPEGTFLPWLPAEPDRFRPVYENRTGLMFAHEHNGEITVRNLADALQRDPVIAKLRAEQSDLLSRLRSARREAQEQVTRAQRASHLL